MENSSRHTKKPNLSSNKPGAATAPLPKRYRFSVESGDLLLLDGRWHVTHSGLIRLARRSHCAGIHVEPVAQFSDPANARWAFKATVYKSRTCRGFVGYGDANPLMSRSSFTAPRCAWPKHVPSTAPCAKPMELESAQSGNRFSRRTIAIVPGVKEAPAAADGRKRWQPHSSRSPLPDYSPASTRSHLGQGLRHGILLRQSAPRCHPRTSRKLRHASGRLGGERPQCSALPTQQLSRPERRCA